jgi:iron(II)-dependent oxidoreductase
VTKFEEGVSVGGVYQLIGNVWEWTHSNFGAWDEAARRLEIQGAMKSLRGGAFDTYFDSQATCQFQSGDSSIARKHNIGFRCCLGLCDLAPNVVDDGSAPEAEQTDVDEETRALEAAL